MSLGEKTIKISLQPKNHVSVNTFKIVVIKKGKILEQIGKCFYDERQNLQISLSFLLLKKWIIAGAILTPEFEKLVKDLLLVIDE